MLFSVLLCAVLLSHAAADTPWRAFNLQAIDEHLIQEHYFDWMFGYVNADSLEFFFQAHDADGNSKLDGLELLHALHHQNTSTHTSTTQQHWHEDSLVINSLLDLADADQDGLLDFYEYIVSRKRQVAH